MSTIYVLCGIPGSGKSTWARHYIEENPNTKLISSDAIRAELFGDESDQSHNIEAFNEFYNRANKYLLEGYDIILDATHTSRRARYRLFCGDLSIKTHTIICKVFPTPVEVCIERDAKRARSVGENVIRKFYNSFQIPYIEEGWDRIDVIYEVAPSTSFSDFFRKMEGFNQKTKWHQLTLDKHCEKVYTELLEISSDRALLLAALLHDYGKLYTQSFDENGEAHYYNHASVGTYELLSHGYTNLKVLFYINYHMYPFSWVNDKTVDRYKLYFGAENVRNLVLLNRCDEIATK